MPDRHKLSRSIQEDPLNLRKWTQLQQRYLEAGDHLSAKSLGVIVQGLAELTEKTGSQDFKLTNMQRHAFSRLAMAHNNSGLLKEIGIFYLHEFKLPGIAIQHFEMAKRFRTSDGDLDALLANAKSAQDRTALKHDFAESGVLEAKHARPPAKEMLRRTGKLSFHQKTEGIPALPREFNPEISKAKAAGTGDPNGAASDGGETTSLVRIARDQRLEHEGEYLSIQQASEKLEPLARAGQYDSALTLLEAIIAASPRHDLGWTAATQLGQTCFQLRQFEWAAASFQHAANLLPDEMVSWFNLGLAMQNLGRLQEAMEVYERADQLQPDHPKVWCNMSALYFQSDQLDQAEHAARKSLDADPQYARAWDNLASALGAQGQMQEAEQAARRAVSLKPDFREPWLKLGMIYFQQERLDESEDAFGQAQELAEVSAYALCYLAIIHARKRRLKEAVASAEEAERHDPHCEMLWMSWNEIGMAHLQLRQPENAVSFFGKTIECQPENFHGWFNQALAFQRSGQLKEAQRCYRKALDREPNSHTAWRSLGHVARDLRNDLAAVEAFAQLIELEPDNAAAWSDYAGALEQAGEHGKAGAARAKARDITNRRNAEANRLGKAFSYLRSQA